MTRKGIGLMTAAVLVAAAFVAIDRAGLAPDQGSRTGRQPEPQRHRASRGPEEERDEKQPQGRGQTL